MEQFAVDTIINRLDRIGWQHRLFWSIFAATLIVGITVVVTILVREPTSSNGRYQLAVTEHGVWGGQITRIDTRTGAIQVFVGSHVFPVVQRNIGFDKKIELVELSSLAAAATEERK